MMFYTITPGELGVVRTALEEGDASDRADAMEIVNGIFEKNVKITITKDMMYKNPMDEKLNDEELAIIESEEEHRTC